MNHNISPLSNISHIFAPNSFYSSIRKTLILDLNHCSPAPMLHLHFLVLLGTVRQLIKCCHYKYITFNLIHTLKITQSSTYDTLVRFSSSFLPRYFKMCSLSSKPLHTLLTLNHDLAPWGTKPCSSHLEHTSGSGPLLSLSKAFRTMQKHLNQRFSKCGSLGQQHQHHLWIG